MAAVSARAAAVAAQTSLTPLEHPADVDSSLSSSLSSLSSSPRQCPIDLSSPILEEGDETESEPPNEPVTPVSGRQSHDFHQALHGHDLNFDSKQESLHAPDQTVADFTPSSKPSLALVTPATARQASHCAGSQPPAPSTQQQQTTKPNQPQSLYFAPTAPASNVVIGESESDSTPGQSGKRSSRGSTSIRQRGIRKTFSDLFNKKGNSDAGSMVDKSVFGAEPSSSDPNLQGIGARAAPTRSFPINIKSSATTRTNSPPSPGSPSELVRPTHQQASLPTVPGADQFIKNKTRASTGLHFGRIGFLSSNNSAHHSPISRFRASSFEDAQEETLTSQLWGLPAAEGTGVKARRMSLSLPDDFTVDIGNLLTEFEYQHKLLGRHGKHLGKGATSKVTLMVRKGNPGELYAVKEFRTRMSGDTVEEYEKKIKSEYTLAKSLHHPNIIETIRLCTDHGRWNHVMEYCQEGDLFSLVKKGYLKGEDRAADRLCLFKQLLQAVNYLHDNGIAHRDIKLENLLMTSDSRLKLTDFGVSEVFCGIHPGLREAGGQCGQKMGDIRLSSPGICGSLPYIAPEVVSKQGSYDPRGLDVWSSAIVMICLIFGSNLWDEASVRRGNANYNALAQGWEKYNVKNMAPEYAGRILSQKLVPHVPAFDIGVQPPPLKRVLLQMLNTDPTKRPTISQVLDTHCIKAIECCQMESYDDPPQMIDASKIASLNRGNQRKVFCHNHLPPSHQFGSHSLGKMPGQAGY